jgi:FlaA1/EpsC-like NDP-sugar epimerase
LGCFDGEMTKSCPESLLGLTCTAVWLPSKNTPRWLIFTIDMCICLLAYIFAYHVRFEFKVPRPEVVLGIAFLPWLLSIRALGMLLGSTYAGIIRFTGSKDTQRIFTVLSLGSLCFVAANLVRFYFFDGKYFLPFSIIILEYLMALFAMVVLRIGVKMMYMELKTPDKVRSRVAIFGAGDSGHITKRTIDRDARSGKAVVAFFDDDPKKSGKKIEGVSIYHSDKMDDYLASGKLDEVIFAIQQLPASRKKEVVDKVINAQVKVSNIPPPQQWINGELSVKQIRDVRIEDLLGRAIIRLDDKVIDEIVMDRVVLVTGAAGSIGSELARQILQHRPKLVVMLDQAETPLFELENECFSAGYRNFEVVIGDVRQLERMRRVFEHFKPEIVFHAAAYKHVPMMENNPSEALLANVLGSRIVADLAAEYGVNKFVLISTDKAVNPTNVMGASKRVAELYVQSKNATVQTSYITTRFGNVLGSNGSVIPIFRRQIEEGGPVTVTHPEVTRFFMTIPEAVRLVLEAAAMGQGGEIFAFDMGESVKVVDLARNMIKLSGLELGKDIEIKFTGLRPGEKLYEEVLSDGEETLPTHHPKIVIATRPSPEFKAVAKDVDHLIALFDQQDNMKIVSQLKAIVPEYISNNSAFEALDK